METLYGVYPENLQVEHDTESKKVVVSNRFYEVQHDVARGGAISSIRYTQASDTNLLREPMHSSVTLGDGTRLSDVAECSPEVVVSSDEKEVRVGFRGCLRDAEGKDVGIRYEFDYVYRWGYIKACKRFIFPESGASARGLCVLRYVLRKELSYWGYRPAPEAEPGASPFGFGVCQWGRTRPGSHFDCDLQTRFIPRYLVNADHGREGIEWFVSSDLAQWSYQIAERAGCGQFAISPHAEAEGVVVEISPLSLPRGDVDLDGTYQFDFYLGLPILSGRALQPFVHTAFNRHDWPTNERVREWAESGIRTAHFHHDGDSYSDGLFWRDGTYPPFGPEDMAEYDRVIKACHDNGIRVATYFSNKELHPSTRAFQEHAEEWGRKADDRGELIHNYHKDDEFGAQMCLRSGWLDYLKQYIDTVLSHHELDGVYYDWNVGLYCHNPLHVGESDDALPDEQGLGAMALSPAGHWDMDELMDLMEWTRERVGPDGLVIVHNTMVPCAAVENFADYVVAMEWGYGRLATSVPKPDELPLEWNFLGARSRGVIGYGTLLPTAPQSLQRQMTLLCAVTGVVPWTANETTLELFAPLKGLDLSGYHYFDWRSGAVQIDNPALYAATYVKHGQALALVANLSGAEQAGTCRLMLDAMNVPETATCRVSAVGTSTAPEQRFAAREPMRLTVEADGLLVMEVE